MGGQRKTVLWTRTSQALDQSLQLAAVGGSLRLLDKLGASSQISDGGAGDKDGRRDGWVKIGIDGGPRLVQDLSQPTPTATITPTATAPPRHHISRAPPHPTPTRHRTPGLRHHHGHAFANAHGLTHRHPHRDANGKPPPAHPAPGRAASPTATRK
ncbi:MAG: hypothetical protein KIS63_06740 [Caldilineales bacterium]|nr:hypothetical protein [Caldilineales bacterium]